MTDKELGHPLKQQSNKLSEILRRDAYYFTQMGKRLEGQLLEQ